MNTICHTSYAQMARHIGVTRGALSQSIYGNGGIKPETALSIMTTYRRLAQQQRIPLPFAWERFFLLSSFPDSEKLDQAEESLEFIEFVARVISERNEARKHVVEVLRRRVDPTRDLIIALAEIRQLKGEIARLKGDAGDS